MFGQLVEAGGVGGDEVLAVAVLLDDHVDHGEDEREVGARLDGVPLVGLGGGDREPGIEVDQLGLPLHHAADEIHRVGRDDALEAVRAGHDDVFAIEQIEAGHRAKRGAVGQVHRGQAQRRMPHEVRRAEGQAEVLEEDLLEALGGGPEGRLGAVLRLHLGELLGGEVEGFVPAHGLPLAFAPGPHADHGLLEAVGIVDLLDGRVAARAEHVTGFRVLGVGVQLLHEAALDHSDGGTLVGAQLAGRRDFPVVGGGGASLLEVFEASHLNGGDGSGGDARGLQEQAAIHASGSHRGLPDDTGMVKAGPEGCPPGPDGTGARTSLRSRRTSSSPWRESRTAASGSCSGRRRLPSSGRASRGQGRCASH